MKFFQRGIVDGQGTCEVVDASVLDAVVVDVEFLQCGVVVQVIGENQGALRGDLGIVQPKLGAFLADDGLPNDESHVVVRERISA